MPAAPPPDRPAPPPGSRRRAGLILLAAALALPELLLWGADLGLWGSARWRPMAYSWGAFWAGLLHGWQSNFPLQPWTMFLSYGALHAGPVHLAGNLAALAWLGPRVAERAGRAGFWQIWGAAWLGGAVAFGLLSRQAAPMVGASGALFGLAAALLVWEAQARQGRRRLAWALAAVLGLALLNLVDWALHGGRLAWQTHLGGVLAGAAVAAVWRRGPAK